MCVARRRQLQEGVATANQPSPKTPWRTLAQLPLFLVGHGEAEGVGDVRVGSRVDLVLVLRRQQRRHHVLAVPCSPIPSALTATAVPQHSQNNTRHADRLSSRGSAHANRGSLTDAVDDVAAMQQREDPEVVSV
eukprot:2403482-Rhodomonas_salina.1